MIILNPLYNHQQSQELSESIVNLYNEKIKGTDNELKFKTSINQWLNDKSNMLQPNDRTFIKLIVFGRADAF